MICEKPLVLNPWNVDALEEIERETSKKVYTILQLRLHPAIIALRKRVQSASDEKRYKVNLKYITSRGNWYQASWKGEIHKSGGIATNIGVHFFDMLIWIFGDVTESIVNEHSSQRAAGILHLEKADVNWMLSIDADSLPQDVRKEGKRTFRSLNIDGEEFEFSEGFTELHTRSYEEILADNGFPLQQTKKSIQLVHDIRNCKGGQSQ